MFDEKVFFEVYIASNTISNISFELVQLNDLGVAILGFYQQINLNKRKTFHGRRKNYKNQKNSRNIYLKYRKNI